MLQEVCVLGTPIRLFFESQTCDLASSETLSRVISSSIATISAMGLYHGFWRSPYATSILFAEMPFLRRLILKPIVLPSRVLLSTKRTLNFALTAKTWLTSDPRDYAFVLRGLHPALTALRVDYNDTVEIVYTDATLQLLRGFGHWSQTIWSQPSLSPYLPSWVFDFSTNIFHTDTTTLDMEDNLLYCGKFDTCAGASMRYEFDRAHQMLSTSAFVCDEIDGISRCLTDDVRHNYLGGWEHMEYRGWFEWVKLIKSHGIRDLGALLRTTCAGLALENKPFAPEDGLLFWDHAFGKGVRMPERSTSEAEKKALAQWKAWIIRLAVYKRLFITKGSSNFYQRLNITFHFMKR